MTNTRAVTSIPPSRLRLRNLRTYLRKPADGTPEVPILDNGLSPGRSDNERIDRIIAPRRCPCARRHPLRGGGGRGFDHRFRGAWWEPRSPRSPTPPQWPPAEPAFFSNWTLIYLGFLTLAIWQALPAHRTDPRQHRAGWWLAAAMILNAAWIA
ncbi:conserved hypothetical protein [Rhodococcus jostii RHA1]|uniref:Uncharacterized protein n=1 Tax=Rhodococcus jostii (strain RHA1) TaxID=101510 RepID=Q0SBN1_RHOJR|nr:conserved hypothetical protein [Rhodococcus jostii RHA1]